MSIAAQAWANLDQGTELLGLLHTGPAPLLSQLAVGRLAADSVGVASLAARLVPAARRGSSPGPVQGCTPLSGFWATADCWAGTHGNHPHHAERLRALLGLGPTAGPEQLRTALARSAALELE